MSTPTTSTPSPQPESLSLEGLTQQQQSMLRFWAEKLAADDELDHIFAAITRKAGWKP